MIKKIKIRINKLDKLTSVITVSGYGISYGVDVDHKKNIYIPSFDRGLIYKISSNLKVVKSYDLNKKGLVETKQSFGHILKPHEVSFDSKKNIYITEMGYGYGNCAGRVTKISPSGKLLKIIGLNHNNGKGLNAPTVSFRAKDKCLYVSEWKANKILRYNKKYELTGWLGKFNGYEKEKKEFFFRCKNKKGYLNHPHALRLGPDNNLYVVDTNNHRIVKYDINGNYIGWLGKKENGIINNNWSKNGNSVKGKELGAFSGPLDLEFYNNKIYISDNDNHRILKLDLSGKVMGWIGKSNKSNRNIIWMTKGYSSRDKGIYGFSNPFGLRVRKNFLYVADRGNNRIKVIKSKLIN